MFYNAQHAAPTTNYNWWPRMELKQV